jgi:hypothetical protein
VEQLRVLYRRAPTTHARAVMLGGMKTLATRRAADTQIIRCQLCGEGPPYLKHILWQCTALASLRSFREPASELAARLGWCWPLDVPMATAVARLEVMGQIRSAEARSRVGPGGPQARA